MLLSVGIVAATLLAAEPGSTAKPQAAAGESCTTCGTESEGTCSAPQAGAASEEISDAEWSEFIRRKLAEAQREPPEPVDPDPFAFSLYRGMRPEPMGEQTLINGARMEIAQLIVPDAPHEVEKAYYETFERMGFRPLAAEIPNTRGVRYLSFRPTGSKKLKTVTLVPNGSGTVILASVGNPEELLVKKPELPGGLPVPPNAEAASTIQQTEPGAATRTAFFVVKDTTPEVVREFYRQELSQRGYSPVPHSAQEGSESYEKGGMLLSLSARPHTEPNTVAVSLVWLQ